LSAEALPVAVLAQRALDSASEPQLVRELAAIQVRRLGPQLNWANSSAIVLLRDSPDDPAAMEMAAGILGEIVAMKPHAASLRINLASALTNLGRHEEAIAHIVESERVLADRGLPVTPQRRLNAVATFRRAGRLDEAARRLDEVVALVRSGSEPAETKEALQASIATERRLLAEANEAKREKAGTEP
jgi:tetratricopeptide (TPR) repeat protein